MRTCGLKTRGPEATQTGSFQRAPSRNRTASSLLSRSSPCTYATTAVPAGCWSPAACSLWMSSAMVLVSTDAPPYSVR